MKSLLVRLLATAVVAGGFHAVAAAQIRALILDGQNNHNWQATTPLLKKYLEETGLFTVGVATSPPKGKDMSGFKPDFAKFDVIVSNYNGDEWPAATKSALENHIRNGGGFVVVHAANNSFGNWPAYNEMIGLGGWGGRSEKSGPYLYWDAKAKKVIKDIAAGRGGSHGAQHEFVVELRKPDHPIVNGLPKRWLHGKDELYDRLRGPARDVEVLATAYSDPETKGSGRHEPMLMTVKFGKGRVFHTPMGHAREADAPAFHCVGFITTLQRGAEWAATGKVTQPVPADFPTAEKISLRN